MYSILMKSKAWRPMLLHITAAIIVGGIWAFHIAEAGHDLKDNDCQVCAIFCSPELNSDCGTRLVAKPENFSSLTIIPAILPGNQAVLSSFNSRAPPVSA